MYIVLYNQGFFSGHLELISAYCCRGSWGSFPNRQMFPAPRHNLFLVSSDTLLAAGRVHTKCCPTNRY